MNENPFKIWNNGEGYTTVSYIEFDGEILFLSMESICNELNKLYNEKEMYRKILKEIMVQIKSNETYCKITVMVPPDKYEEFSKLMLND